MNKQDKLLLSKTARTVRNAPYTSAELTALNKDIFL